MVDEARNVVSYIHSLYPGNGVVAGDTGMGSQTSWTDASLSFEGRFGEAVTRSFKEREHTVESIGDWAAGGAAQVVGVEDRMLASGGDPRPGTSSVVGN